MRHYHGLDLLRFASAMMVVFFHLAQTSGSTMGWRAAPGDAPLSWMDNFGWFGWIGVQIFFVLSGFIISASAKNATAATFVKKRAIRVLPALWLAVPLALILRWYWGEPMESLIGPALRSAFLLPQGPYIDGVIWTLVVEAVFYALIALLLAISAKGISFQRVLGFAALALGLASTAFLCVQWFAIAGGVLAPDTGLRQAVRSFGFDVTLLRHGVFFAVGILLFEISEGRKGKLRYAALALFTLACWLQIHITTGLTGPSIVPIVIWTAAIALSAASIGMGERLWSSTMWSITRPIGRLTYPLYLNHFVVSQAVLPLFAAFIANQFLLGGVMLAFLLTLAAFIALGPEQAVQGWAKQRLLAPKTPAMRKAAPAAG